MLLRYLQHTNRSLGLQNQTCSGTLLLVAEETRGEGEGRARTVADGACPRPSGLLRRLPSHGLPLQATNRGLGLANRREIGEKSRPEEGRGGGGEKGLTEPVAGGLLRPKQSPASSGSLRCRLPLRWASRVARRELLPVPKGTARGRVVWSFSPCSKKREGRNWVHDMATWRAWDAPISTDRTEREQEDGNVPSPGGMVSFSK